MLEQAADGASLYQLLGKRFGNNDAASTALQQAGIPGIRYLDGGSRGAGKGLSNYVIFPGNEGLLSILERNGVPVQKPFVYPQGKALETAQRNAAKPVSEGGLGLPANNTPMDRAKAMGYPMNMYGTPHESIGYTSSTVSAPRKKAEIIKAELEQMGIPVHGEQATTGSTYLKFPANPYQIDPRYGGGQEVPIEQMRFSTHSTRSDRIPLNSPNSAYVADVFPKNGNSLDEARTKIKEMIDSGGIRSRFAAFDPARRNESDLLGRIDPQLLNILAAGGLLGAGYSARQDK